MGARMRPVTDVANTPRTAAATCTLCEATCGILVGVEGDHVRSVRGDTDDPMSRGFVCPKVVGMQDLHADPDRLRRPLVREGDRLRPASWEEALGRAAEGIVRTRNNRGKDAVAIYQGNPTVHNLGLLTLGQAFFRTLGTRNLYSASTADQIPHMRAAHEMFGHAVFIPVPDVDRTHHWLVIGANPAVSNGSLMTAPDIRRRIAAIRDRGGKVVVVDPRRTETAKLADEHVFLRPGTDPLLLFAMIHTLFEESLAQPGPVGRHLASVAELRGLARRFSPERVAAATGVSAATIRTMTREFAAAKAAACYVRVGTCHQEHGTLASWLAWALAALTGNLDRPGGSMWTLPAVDLVDISERFGLRGAGKFRSRVRGLPETAGELPVATLADEIETPGPGQIRALVTSAGNPVLSAPNGPRLERAFASLDHMVCVDGYVNETTRHAHVILPPCSALQRPHYDLALNAFAVRNVAKWVDPVLPRDPEDKDDGEILLELARRVHMGRLPAPMQWLLGRAEKVATAERVVDLGLRIGPYGVGRGGLSVAELRRHPHGLDLGPLTPRLPKLLRTPSGKVELCPPAFAAEVPFLEKDIDRAVPELVLIGRRQLRSNNSWMHNAERLVKGPRRCTLLVHPADAARLALREGANAAVTSATGSVVCPVEISDEVMQGVVSLPHGWGHHRPGTRLRVASEHAGVSINDITDDARLDRLTGNAAFSGTPVEVAPAS